MNRSITAIIAASALATLAVGHAEAGVDQENVKMCRAEMLTQMPAMENADQFKLRSIRGASVKKLSFDYKINEERHRVVCKVKRGEIVGIDWNK